jgi:glycine dehydrogenase subunit 2
MKLIFEYDDEQTSKHIPDVNTNNGNSGDDDDDDGNKVTKEIGSADILTEIPHDLLRKELPLPDVSELTVVRHFTNMSLMNFGIDMGFYPLGSCTMKYNPKVNENIASLDGFKNLHPLSHEDCVQGALQLMWELEQDLKTITGMNAFSLQPGEEHKPNYWGL